MGEKIIIQRKKDVEIIRNRQVKKEEQKALLQPLHDEIKLLKEEIATLKKEQAVLKQQVEKK